MHHALFEHRHNGGGSLRDEATLRRVIGDAGADADAAFTEVASGRPLAAIREEHTTHVRSHHVWGTPTFVMEDKAVFVRLLDHSHGDAAAARSTVDRIIADIRWPILNEFKHTSVPM
ncbi:MAG: DsbA family protein [Actinomycetota bacterium]